MALHPELEKAQDIKATTMKELDGKIFACLWLKHNIYSKIKPVQFIDAGTSRQGLCLGGEKGEWVTNL